MKRALVVGLLSFWSGAQAAYCFDAPGTNDDLFRFLRGSPKHLEQVNDASGTKDDLTVQASFQQKRIAELVQQTRFPDRTRLDHVVVFKQLGANKIEGRLSFPNTNLLMSPLNKQVESARLEAKNYETSPPALSLTYDAQGRLSTYSGFWIQMGSFLPRQVKATCIYGQQTVIETVNIMREYRSVSTTKLDSRGKPMFIDFSTQKYDGPLDLDTFIPALSAVYTSRTIFEYSQTGELTGARIHVPTQRNAAGELVERGQPETVMSFTLDRNSNIIREERRADGQTTTVEFTYDSQGNWIKRVARSPVKTISTTRTFTY